MFCRRALLRSRSLTALALCCLAASAGAAEVVIYRCTDAQGRLTLRDTPCAAGQRQQTQTMLRPVDPPPRPTPATDAPAAPAPTPAAAPRPRVVVVQPPRPMYECVTPDGERYTSDTSEGNPRWLPLWSLGYPAYLPRNPLGDRVGAPPPRLGDPDARLPRDGRGYGVLYGGNTLVRDECHALPQQEVCARLRDRRYQLDRRYNSALQSERAQIVEQQRGIDARLNTDCGAY
ncbi:MULTISPECIES: DUF4124 domain-containing protein [Lysobacter]|uniref:DUF4124 domain-containing protein n=1 Tax=Lysobacter firmicutimachus TaxID=1792846 RepID=A0ABU8CXC4_9GAMM|nr:DUF4124 domain-containing protein [Lysobacter antibioticus]